MKKILDVKDLDIGMLFYYEFYHNFVILIKIEQIGPTDYFKYDLFFYTLGDVSNDTLRETHKRMSEFFIRDISHGKIKLISL